MPFAIEESTGEETAHVFGPDRAISHTSVLRFNFDHRLEPVESARSRAHNLDVERSTFGRITNSSRDSIGADGNRSSVARDENTPLHLRASAISADTAFASSLPTGAPSSSAAGAQAQMPRQ